MCGRETFEYSMENKLAGSQDWTEEEKLGSYCKKKKKFPDESVGAKGRPSQDWPLW